MGGRRFPRREPRTPPDPTRKRTRRGRGGYAKGPGRLSLPAPTPYDPGVAHPTPGTNPELTVAIALATGVLMQMVARHLRIPGIVLLLLSGVLLGPDGFGIIDPAQIEGIVHGLVSFAVAVILFEGGMNLNLGRLRQEARVIRLLVTTGALVTGIGGTLVAKLILGWGWQLSILFGSLVIVTGPTVITPLLRRIRVRANVETILEAEGVLIDAVGAVLAVVTLQIALQPSGSSFLHGLLGVAGRLAVGAGFGVAGGVFLALLLRPRKLVPEGLENIFVLGTILFLFQLSNSILGDSGIGTVVVAGLVVGNVRTRVSRDLLQFKEQLTILFIGLLFVLLAASVRLADVEALGKRGILAVAALMFLVRPANIFSAVIGSNLDWRERAFLCWLAPRGIVAAAVASLFAQTLRDAGLPGGDQLRAMVFLVIAGTVLVQGLTGGLVARLLGLQRPSEQGYVILGASALGRALGTALRGEDPASVVFMDSNAEAAKNAQDAGFEVIVGNALEEASMARAQLDGRAACLAVTTNEEINMLFARRATDAFKVRALYVALQEGRRSVTEEMVRTLGARVLFGRERDLELWDVRLRRRFAVPELWEIPRRGEDRGTPEVSGEYALAAWSGSGRREDPELRGTPEPIVAPGASAGPGASGEAGASSPAHLGAPREGESADVAGDGGMTTCPDSMLPLAIRKGARWVPFSRDVAGKRGDRAWFAILLERREEAEVWLRARGWVPVGAEAERSAGWTLERGAGRAGETGPGLV